MQLLVTRFLQLSGGWFPFSMWKTLISFTSFLWTFAIIWRWTFPGIIMSATTTILWWNWPPSAFISYTSSVRRVPWRGSLWGRWSFVVWWVITTFSILIIVVIWWRSSISTRWVTIRWIRPSVTRWRVFMIWWPSSMCVNISMSWSHPVWWSSWTWGVMVRIFPFSASLIYIWWWWAVPSLARGPSSWRTSPSPAFLISMLQKFMVWWIIQSTFNITFLIFSCESRFFRFPRIIIVGRFGTTPPVFSGSFLPLYVLVFFFCRIFNLFWLFFMVLFIFFLPYLFSLSFYLSCDS